MKNIVTAKEARVYSKISKSPSLKEILEIIEKISKTGENTLYINRWNNNEDFTAVMHNIDLFQELGFDVVGDFDTEIQGYFIKW